MSFFGNIEGALKGGLLWQPIKKATGLTDAQMIGIGAMAVGAPYALPMMGSAGTAGASTAGTSATGGLLNFSGGQAAAPIVDLSTTAAPGSVGQVQAAGGLSNLMGYGKAALGGLKEYGPAGAQAVDAAYKANSMAQGQQQQFAPAQFQQGQGFAGLLNPTDQVDPEKRRQAQQMAVQGLLSGYGGRYG